ncbi:inner centromere protein-like isoform X1 [Hypanus sabinus]|uniref:inner centromere protein-like isoform X1 n=1 Tax=Hypanus sabinus TaxID=79690 RepID=UPI0028C41F80|nr:inner centromere protein-like isoform X1 [Hypanus sabinus]XP_059831610.1 inner centromere protein-like isoform X1 [Hypanus sabinus]XP_059831611.1 inner centromere protein-like isoform X1 [Hypanus sabinus]XP_059831612.1 inner centromere protein-like isoform X1 [Hypanus sabinus]
MASRTAITMLDTDNVLKFFGEKLNGIIESFKENEIWLNEIQEEAMMMFVSGFNAEPELMPKTPSERKRRRRCPSMAQDPNKRFSRSRRSLRRSSVKRIKLRNRVFEEDDKCSKMVGQTEPAGLTRSASCAATTLSREPEKAIMLPVVPINSRAPMIDLSPNGCKSAELHEKAQEACMGQPVQISEFVNLPQKTGNNSIEKTKENLNNECVEAISFALEPKQPEEELPAALASEEVCRNSQNPTKVSISCSENMTVAAIKPQACKTSRNQRKDNINSDKVNSANRTDGCKNSCKQGVEGEPSDPGVLSSEDLLLKGPASPSASKVVQSKHTKFFHAVQNNQLFKTPVSVGRSMVKSFILRKTPVKVDAKEMVHKANLKKQEQEGKRIQKPEEEKKHKLGEFKKKQELRLKHVLEARTRVEQQEGKKKKKIEQKHLQTDNKKLRKEKLSEERAKKLTLKKTEGESQKCQEEDRQRRLLQTEEQQQDLQRKEEGELQRQCKPAEAKELQELERPELNREQHDLHWIADKECEGKQQDNLLVEKEQGCLAKESLHLQKKQEQTMWKEAQPVKEKLSKGVQEKVTSQEEQQIGEPESWSLKSEKTQRTQLEHNQQAEESKLESWVIKLKKQDGEAMKIVSNNNVLNKTMEVHHPAELESYSMTPGSYSKVKLPKINLQNYGMDLNSDDSTDDEEMPRKPIPSWADGKELQQALLEQYYHPLNLDELFSVIKPPNLEAIFGKRKPRYLKRTSSAVWHSPPGSTGFQNISRGFVKH